MSFQPLIFNGFVIGGSSGGGGSGTVTSVALSLPGIFTVSGSPVTTSGTLTGTLVSQTANTFFAAPNGSSGTPTFRAIVSTDLPSLSGTYVPQSEVGIANGVASLDGGGKVPIGQLPSSVMEYEGAWNPSTNTPTLSDGTGTNGNVYYVTALFAGPISGLTDPSMHNFQIGDIVIYSSSVGKWQLTTPAAGVQSVNSLQGVVVLTQGNLTDSTSGADGITVTGGTNSVWGTGTSIAQQAASTSQNGYLTAANFTIFNNKQPAGNYAATNLNNLVTTQVNQSLIPSQTTLSLGSLTGFQWQNLYVGLISSGSSSSANINVNSRSLYDSSGELSLDYQSRFLNDSAGNISIDYQNRYLLDNGGDYTLDYQNHLLIANDGATTMLDFSTAGTLNASTNTISNVVDPVNPQDAMTLNYANAHYGTGSGSVTSVSVVSANGLAGTVATSTTTPAITLSTTITGVLKGNGTAISAATAGTDYVIPSGSITGTASNITATSNSTLTTLSSLSLPGTQVTGNISGNAANITATSNSTLTTLSTLSLPGSQITGNISGNATNITATSNSTLTTLSSLSLPYSQVTGGPAAGITALTGDVTASGTGSVAATLATVNSNVGTFGSSTSIPTFTVNAKGLITAASGNVVIAPAGTLSGTTLNSTVVISSLTSLGAQSQALNMNSNLINNVTPGVAGTDAVNLNQLNSAVQGINPAVAVQAATTSAANTSSYTYNNGVGGVGATFTGPTNTALTVDGYTFTALGQRLLVKNDTQSPSGAFNGIYFVTQLQALGLPLILTRALDYDQPSDINNTGAIPVINGTVNGTTQWVETALVNTIGADPLVFALFSANPSSYLLAANNLSDVNSKSTSFNNINPMTTTGDLIYESATNVASRLSIGTNGQVLTVSGGIPSWQVSGTSPTNNYYSGYMPNSTSWSTTSSTQAALTNSGSNTLTKIFGNGITITAASSNVAGISFTPLASGSVYKITATMAVGLSGGAGQAGFFLTDGTTNFASNSVESFGQQVPVSLTGIYVFSSGLAATISIQAAQNVSGTFTINNNVYTPSITWEVIQIA